MAKRNPIRFFEDFSFEKRRRKGRTTVISFNRGWGSWAGKTKGLVRWDKTSTGGRKADGSYQRTYEKTIELNDEEKPREVMKKLYNIRRLTKTNMRKWYE